MKTFLEFIEIIFLLIGHDIDGRFSSNPRKSKALSIWKYSYAVLVSIGTIQIWIYSLMVAEWSSAQDSVFVVLYILFWFEAVVGYLTLLSVKTKSWRLISNISDIYGKIIGTLSNIEDEKVIKSTFNLGRIFWMLMNGSVILTGILITIKAAVESLFQIKSNEEIPNYMWFPFDAREYLFISTFCSFTIIIFYNLLISSAPLLIFITSSYLSACFFRLADNLEKVADEADICTIDETKKRLSKTIDIHNELFKMADELNEVFGVFNLILMTDISLTFCVFSIIIMIGSLETASQFSTSAIMTTLLIMLFCRVGDKLNSSSMEVAKVIERVDLLKMDPVLRRHVFFIIQVSNRPKKIATMGGFFEFDWTSCTMIVQKTYSYIALIRHILKL